MASSDGIVEPFLGALQACVSVLLTLFWGLAARKMKLLKEQSINDLSGLGVKVFLPALLVVNLGSQLHLDTGLDYIPVLVWSIVYTVLSILMSQVITKILKLPPWVTPACAFNNTTSLPLFLIQSLESAGSLKLIIPDGSSMSDAVERSQSYFLVCAVISKVIAYAVGPKMLQDGDNADDHDEENQQSGGDNQDAEPSEEQLDEETPLLPESVHKAGHKVASPFKHGASYVFSLFPKRVKQELVSIDSPFVDTAILCALTGLVLGLVPPLHKAFFDPYDKGGIFNAWLTASVKNVGKLFTTSQVFVVGAKLGVSFERMRRSEGSGKVPKRAILTIFLIRLVVWPAISISIIYGLALKTSLVRNDPVLWFTMMLMPTGPPALIISGLAELAKVSEVEKFAVAKALALMYALSPFVCFTITGALKATQAVVKQKQ
ncbi:Auxin Efflux Carrier superfamily [Paecilomyces variotii No. 5]|uniref:Auxin Efflux Carrier superfamily n=1 Tax=Byssochlamys spectabilis (strain No. 5 / NBRC 109023) TaxID=1356009 RepID=V5F831_BYSSN|nr:Auxin Efflux Carrier superfamily [Paecilomyces variotii No. 5]